MSLVSQAQSQQATRSTHPPVVVSYKSVRGRFVGVSLTHVARSLINRSRVSSDAIAAANSSQSPKPPHRQPPQTRSTVNPESLYSLLVRSCLVSSGTPYFTSTVG